MSVVTLYALNLVDLLCTLYALYFGAQELNPLMQSVPVLIVYKVIIVGGLLWWLSGRTERAARKGFKICTVVYAVLAVYHVVGLILMGGDLIC